jgi:hypothetical protein
MALQPQYQSPQGHNRQPLLLAQASNRVPLASYWSAVGASIVSALTLVHARFRSERTDEWIQHFRAVLLFSDSKVIPIWVAFRHFIENVMPLDANSVQYINLQYSTIILLQYPVAGRLSAVFKYRLYFR